MSPVEDVAFAPVTALPVFVLTILPAGEIDRAPVLSFPAMRRKLIDEGHDLRNPDLADQIPQDDFLRFCQQHNLMADEVRQLASGEKTYKVLIKGGLLQNARLNFLLYEQGEPQPPTRDLVPVAEVHRPKVTGCVSAYTVKATEAGNAGIKLSARGIGAGGGLSLTMTFERTISTADRCARVTVPVEYSITRWTNPDSGSVIDVVSVTDVFSTDCTLVPIADDEPGHRCSGSATDYSAQFAHHKQRGAAAAAAGNSVDLGVPSGSTIADTLIVKQSRSFSLKWGEIFEMTSQFTRQYSYAFTLGGGSAYLGFRETPESEAFYWTWKTPG